MDNLNEYLSKSNDELLSSFKWGDSGTSDFYKFIRLVRDELIRADELKKAISGIKEEEGLWNLLG